MIVEKSTTLVIQRRLTRLRTINTVFEYMHYSRFHPRCGSSVSLVVSGYCTLCDNRHGSETTLFRANGFSIINHTSYLMKSEQLADVLDVGVKLKRNSSNILKQQYFKVLSNQSIAHYRCKTSHHLCYYYQLIRRSYQESIGLTKLHLPPLSCEDAFCETFLFQRFPLAVDVATYKHYLSPFTFGRNQQRNNGGLHIPAARILLLRIGSYIS